MHCPRQGCGVQKEMPLRMVHSHVAVNRRRGHSRLPMVLLQACAGPRGTMVQPQNDGTHSSLVCDPFSYIGMSNAPP